MVYMGLLNFLFPFFGTSKKRPDATHSTGRADDIVSDDMDDDFGDNVNDDGNEYPDCDHDDYESCNDDGFDDGFGGKGDDEGNW